MESNSVRAISLKSFDSANILATFQALNGNGLSDAIKILRIVNDSNKDIIISLDGVNDSDIILKNSDLILEFQANASNTPETSGTYNMRKGQIIYGKGDVGNGVIYIGGYR